MAPLVLVAAWTPPPKRVRKHQVRTAVEHAKLICKDYERSRECRVAWGYADELEKAWRKQEDQDRQVAELIWFTDIENREYDV